MIETLDGAGKTCPICIQALPLSEFGVCRARSDGRNLYCKSCIRKKVTDSRRALREYRSARKKGVSHPISDETGLPLTDGDSASTSPGNYPRLTNKMSPGDRVREAIRKGARTQKQIAQETKLGKDEIGDALATLLLWTREIRTEMVDNTRFYYLNENDNSLVREEQMNLPERKRDVPSSFSALQGLMPGKNPAGEPEKIGGWVAA